MLDPEQKAELERRFTYHAPTDEQRVTYQRLRDQCLELATLISELTPSSREQSLALTHLEQANFYANAAIARRS
jgi:hypothetical protein